MCWSHVVLEISIFRYQEFNAMMRGQAPTLPVQVRISIMENGRRQEWPGHSSSKKNPPYQTKASLHFGVNTKLIHECFLSKFDFVHPQPLFLEL